MQAIVNISNNTFDGLYSPSLFAGSAGLALSARARKDKISARGTDAKAGSKLSEQLRGGARKRAPIWLGCTPLDDIRSIPALDLHLLDEGVATSPDEVERLRQGIHVIESIESEAVHEEELKHYILAAELLEKAVDARRKLFGDASEHSQIAIERACSLANNWGLECLAASQYTYALQLLKKAEAWTEPDAAPTFQRKAFLRSVTFGNMCSYFRQRGKLNAALQFAEKSLKLESRFREAHDPSRTLLNYAVLLSSMSRHEEAVEHIERALSLLHDEQRQHESTQGGRHRGQIAREQTSSACVVAWHNLWVEHSKLMKTEKASECLLRAANIAVQELGPEHFLSTKMLQNLAWASECPTLAQEAHGDRDTLNFLRGEETHRPAPMTVALGARATPTSETTVSTPSTALPSFCNTAASYRSASQQSPSNLDEDIPNFTQGRARSTTPYIGRGQLPFGGRKQRHMLEELPPRATTVMSTARPSDSGFERSGRQTRQARSPAAVDNQGDRTVVPTPPTAIWIQNKTPMSQMQHHIDSVSLRDEEPPWPQKTTLSVEKTAAEHLNALKRSLYGERIAAEEISKCDTQCQRINNLTSGRSHSRNDSMGTRPSSCISPISQRLLPSLGGPFENRRRDTYHIVLGAKKSYVERGAAIVIQKAWRGYSTRKIVQSEIARVANGTASMLQSLYRAFREFCMLKRRRCAAIKLQAAWRRSYDTARYKEYFASESLVKRSLLGCFTRSKLRKMRRATILFQRLIRGCLTRRRVQYQQTMRGRIQKVVRGTTVRRRLHREIKGANRIAARCRGFVARKRAREQNDAAVVIQSRYRGHLGRRQVAKFHQASAKIASIWKSYAIRKSMLGYKKIARLQGWFRGILTRKRLALLSPAAFRIQSCWREHRRWRLYRIREAIAVVVQKHYRRHGAVNSIAQRLAGAVGCQRLRRGHAWRRQLNMRHESALQIETLWRGYVARHQVAEMQAEVLKIQCLARMSAAICRRQLRNKAATKICSAWNGHRWRSNHCKRLQLILTIQRFYRGHLARLSLDRRAAAAWWIQRSWRRHLGAQRVRQRVDAAAAIQRVVRQRQCRKRYKALRNVACLAIQASARCRYSRKRFQQKRDLARRLQGIYRGLRSRRCMQQQVDAATAVQCAWRTFFCMARLTRERMAATRIQANLVAILERCVLRREHAAAVKLQRFLRAKRAKAFRMRRIDAIKVISALVRSKHWIGVYANQRHAAIRLQSAWRANRSCKWWAARQRAALRLVTAWRRKIQHAKNVRRDRACRVLEKHVRYFRSFARLRRRTQAAILIQSAWRRKSVWIRAKGLFSAVCLIQSWIRGFLERRRLKEYNKHMGIWFRRAQCLLLRVQMKRMHQNASRIGRVARSHIVVKRLAQKHCAAIKIQRVIRGRLARARVRLLRDGHPLGMQRLCRVKRAKYIVERRRIEALELAAHASKLAAERLEREREQSAIRIQAFVRHKQAVAFRSRVSCASIRIQAFARELVARKRFLEKMQAVLKLQVALRTWLVPRIRTRERKAIIIQRYFLRYRARAEPAVHNSFVRKTGAALKIQKEWRRFAAVQRYAMKRRSAVVIQKQIRTFPLRRIHQQKVAAAIQLQSLLFRAVQACRKVAHRRAQIVRLQTVVRRVSAAALVQRLHAAARPIQAACRRALDRWKVVNLRSEAAVRIQAYVRMWQCSCFGPRPVAWVRRDAGSKISALGHGFLVRKRLRIERAAISHIQRQVRLRLFRAAMTTKRSAVLLLQRVWRGHANRELTYKLQGKGDLFMACARGMGTRRALIPRRDAAALSIQRIYRGRFGRMEASIPPRAITIIQAAWRATREYRRYQKVKLALKQLLTLVYIRRYKLARRELVGGKLRIKSVFLAYLPRARCRQVVKRGIRIQRLQRASFARRFLQLQKMSAATLQALYRRMVVRRLFSRRIISLYKLQSGLLSFLLKRRYAERVFNVVRIQRYVRCRLARRRLLHYRTEATRISKVCRGHLVRKRMLRRKVAASRISRWVKGWLLRGYFARKLDAIRTIQFAWREASAHRILARHHVASTQICAAWRCFKARRHYKVVQRAGCILIGGAWMWKLMRLRVARHTAALKLTAFWRAYCVRANLQHLRECVNKIGNWWRTISLRYESLEMIVEILRVKKLIEFEYRTPQAIVIQRCVRRWLVRRRGIQHVRRAATRIQARFRGAQGRLEARRQRYLIGVRVSRMPNQLMALVKDKRGRLTRCRAFRSGERLVQKTVRRVRLGVLTFRMYEDLLGYALLLQAFERSRRYRRAVRKIQRFLRGFRERRELHRKRGAVVRLQAVRRRLVHRHQFLERRAYAIKIQAFTRGALERFRLQARRKHELAALQALVREGDTLET